MSYTYTTSKIDNLHTFKVYLERNDYIASSLDYNPSSHTLSLSFDQSLSEEQQPILEQLVAEYCPTITNSVTLSIIPTQINNTVYTNYAVYQWMPNVHGTPFTVTTYIYGSSNITIRIYDSTNNTTIAESDTISFSTFGLHTMQLLNMTTLPDTPCVLELQAKVLTNGHTCMIQNCAINFV
jgi:hypothetical protein